MELWDIYDKDGNKLGITKERGKNLTDDEYHLVVNAWIRNSEGKYLISQRSENKKHPLMWECSGGSVLQGETIKEAAIREVKEELGVDLTGYASVTIGRMNRYFKGCPDILDIVLFACGDIKDIKIQKEEVNDAKWATKEEIIKLREEGKFLTNEFFDEAINFTCNDAKDYLDKDVFVEIDRKFGSAHPKKGFIYPVNYGYIPNTISGDGEELDAYVLGVFEPVDTYEGHVIAIIHRTNDNDDKLVVVPEGKEYSDDAIRALTEFQEAYFKSEIIRKRVKK